MRKLFFFTLFATAFFACTDKEATLRGRLAALDKEATLRGRLAALDKEATLRGRLAALDKEFGGANVTDEKKAEEFIVAAEQLAGLVKEKDPNECADLLLKAAGLAKTIENPQKAIELYSKLADGMPQNPKASTALFMIGFVYENDLGDLEKAKATYESFLQKYPNDPDFADDAQTALKMLGKSPEEIIKEFEQQNRDSITQ
jgi:tetratricopeptide (TPR) repeat protein